MRRRETAGDGEAAVTGPESSPPSWVATRKTTIDTSRMPSTASIDPSTALLAPTDAALGAAVVTDQSVPLRIRQALKWMFDPQAPLYIPPRPDPALASWLWTFRRHCTSSHYEAGLEFLSPLGHETLALFDRIEALPDAVAGFFQDVVEPCRCLLHIGDHVFVGQYRAF